ncbi:MAG: ATP-binding protein [Candidatus Nanosalina sp.]
MRRENWPSREELVDHEAGNMLNSAATAFPEKEGEERLWGDYREASELYQDYRTAAEEGDAEAMEEALEGLKAFDSPDTPESSRRYVTGAVSLLEAGEDYERLLNGDGVEDSIRLGEALQPFEWYDRIDAEYDPDVEVSGDRSLRMVSNTMIKNWKDHAGGPDDSKMWVELEEDDEYVHLQVYDDGPGIGEEDPEQLFDYDPEVDSERDRIGLPIAQDITEEFNGSLEYFEPETGGMGYDWKLEKA